MSRLSKSTALALVAALDQALGDQEAMLRDRNMEGRDDEDWLKGVGVLDKAKSELGLRELPPEWFDTDSPIGSKFTSALPDGSSDNIVDGYRYHYQPANPARRIPEGWYRGKKVRS